MPLVPDICTKYKRPVRAVTCNVCRQHFYPGCARDYIKNRPLSDCCKKHLNDLLENMDPKATAEMRRLISLKSFSSNTSSVSSFKSATSSPSVCASIAYASTSFLKSPSTPNIPLSPSID